MGNDSYKAEAPVTEKLTWPGWKIVKEIGAGSYGHVYEIHREEDGNIYTSALKIIHIPKDGKELKKLREDGMDDQAIRSYLEGVVNDYKEEYALMARLRSCPNIVIYDDHKVIENEDGLGWVVMIKMELLTEFRKYIKEVGITDRLVQKVGIDLCTALEACRQEGIVHRDIKLDNIFINHFDNIKLGDFGVARKMDHTVTVMNVAGTYSYMSPEIYHGQPAGYTADIYSVGMVMYRLLNENIGPFETTMRTAKGDEEARNRRFRGDPLPYPRHGSRALQNIVLHALAFRPEDRFQSATEMRKALESLNTTPVTPEPDPDPPKPKPDPPKPSPDPPDPGPGKLPKLIYGLLGVFVVALFVLIALIIKNVTDSSDPGSVPPTETVTGSQIADESVESPDAPKLLVDSTVILLGDTIPVRFFDGENTYAYHDGLSYYSQPNTVTIGADSRQYRYYITANSKGPTTVIGTKDGQKLEKKIYVLDPGVASNSVLCDTEKIVFGVTASGPGAANINISVEGKQGEALEARVYTNVGSDKSRNVWVTAAGEWEDNILNLTVTNYLSPDKNGELVVVITPKGDPSTLIGMKRIPIEIG